MPQTRAVPHRIGSSMDNVYADDQSLLIGG